MADSVSSITTYIQDVAKGGGNSILEALMLEGLTIIQIGKGILRCKLRISDRVSGEDGVWHAGAIASVIEMIGAAVVYSMSLLISTLPLIPRPKFKFDSQFSEEVEIEGRVVASKRGLKGAVVEIRRESNGEIIATGRIWMAQLSLKGKDKVPYISKL